MTGAAVADQVYLAPLAFALNRADVTDIYINRPGELWLKMLGGKIERHGVPTLAGSLLAWLARQVAAQPSGDQPRASLALREPA